MKCALVYRENGYIFYQGNLPKIVEYLNGVSTMHFTDGRLEQITQHKWIDDQTIRLKKVVIGNRLNRTLYPEAKELDGYLILDEDLKTEDFRRTI
jgi:hypothetical protein